MACLLLSDTLPTSIAQGQVIFHPLPEWPESWPKFGRSQLQEGMNSHCLLLHHSTYTGSCLDPASSAGERETQDSRKTGGQYFRTAGALSIFGSQKELPLDINPDPEIMLAWWFEIQFMYLTKLVWSIDLSPALYLTPHNLIAAYGRAGWWTCQTFWYWCHASWKGQWKLVWNGVTQTLFSLDDDTKGIFSMYFLLCIN